MFPAESTFAANTFVAIPAVAVSALSAFLARFTSRPEASFSTCPAAIALTLPLVSLANVSELAKAVPPIANTRATIPMTTPAEGRRLRIRSITVNPTP